MAFRPSVPGERRGGRPKGGKNKLTLEIVNAVGYVFRKMGGKKKFHEWAEAHPDLYYIHFVKPFIPKQVNLADADGKKLEPVRIVRIVAPTVTVTGPALPVNGHSHS